VVPTAAVLITSCGSSGHAGGDPHNRLLDALQPVISAVPAGSTVTDTFSLKSTWSPKCPDNLYGKSGWGPAEVGAIFKSTLGRSTIVSSVNQVLEAGGWRPMTPRDDAAWQYTPIGEWTRNLPTATLVEAVVFSYPSSTSQQSTGEVRWFLGAQAHPPGFGLPGC